MTKQKNKPPRVVGWRQAAFLVLTATRESKVLGVLVDPESFGVVAFETERPAVGGTEVAMAAAVFASHSHAVVGQYESLVGAIGAAQGYALSWTLGKLPATDDCACGEIGGAEP